jgi:hypothetical protein
MAPTKSPSRGAAGRLARPGGSAGRPQAGRFARTSGGQARRSTPRPTRPTRSTPRAQTTLGRVRRRPPQKKGFAKVVSGLLPTGAARKAAPSSRSGKFGGAAALAAAAGVAFRNRDKLSGLLSRGRGQEQVADTPLTSPATSPASPAPPRNGA